MNLTSRIARLIEEERLIEPGERILLGLSGGIDSTVLLHILLEISPLFPFGIGIAHINHLLRGHESMRDEEFVRSLAERFSLPFHSTRIDVRKVARNGGKSLQHAGRDVRYRFYTETAALHQYQKIGVAHTLDDQVETFILRMIKGTGMRGLSAIPMKRASIVRPFLFTARSEIEAYRQTRDIPFVADSSNEKTVYERNFVRKRIVPLMEELNGAFRDKVLALLGDLTAVNRVFEENAEGVVKLARQEAGGDISLPVEEVTRLDEETKFRVMARLLARMEPWYLPLREHMRQIVNVIESPKPNLAAMLPHGIRVRKAYGTLTLTRKAAPPLSDMVFPMREGANRIESLGIALGVDRLADGGADPAFLPGPYTAFLDGDTLGPLSIRTFREGDRFVPLGMTEPVKLKNFFMSRKIPREERRSVPLLVSGDDVVWVIGVRISERHKATRETKTVVRVAAEPFRATR